MKVLPALFLLPTITLAQTLTPLEPIDQQYGQFQKINADSNEARASLDEMRFPMEGPGLQFVGIAPTYLSDKDLDVLKSVIDYPANSSAQTQEELKYLKEWSEKRTSRDKSRAQQIARIGYWPPLERNSTSPGRNSEALFWECDEVLGDCNLSDYPKTLHLLRKITRDVRIVEFTLKYHFRRARPYQLAEDLDPMARISSPSFPSGHTLWAYAHAFTFSELQPSKRKEFLAIAQEVGVSREIMGIHYPSDEEAARVVAHKMLSLIWNKEDFKKDLKAALSEWD